MFYVRVAALAKKKNKMFYVSLNALPKPIVDTQKIKNSKHTTTVSPLHTNEFHSESTFVSPTKLA